MRPAHSGRPHVPSSSRHRHNGYTPAPPQLQRGRHPRLVDAGDRLSGDTPRALAAPRGAAWPLPPCDLRDGQSPDSPTADSDLSDRTAPESEQR